MKITCSFFFITLLVLIGSCHGKNASVKPSSTVVASFESRFGMNLKTQWKKSGQSNYKASFNRNRHLTEAYFDVNGRWLKTESELLSSELPLVVVKTIVGAFKGSAIHKALRVEKSGEGTTYRLTLKTGSRLSIIDFSSDGVILNNTVSK